MESVVAAATGGTPESCGRWTERDRSVRPASAQALSEAIGRVLFTQSLARSLGAAGRQLAEKFALEDMTKATENAYKQALERGGTVKTNGQGVARAMKAEDASSTEGELLVSIVISTFNRCGALVQTLLALGQQTIPPDQYEVIVVDDGSPDNTFSVASQMTLPCALRVFRHEQNRGVSAGRNLAMRHARGRYLILVSDDLIVPENFVATHLNTLARFLGFWVVGGLEQLPSLTETPFGRYLDDWERQLDDCRKQTPLAEGIWEMAWPTARNLSLPRADYERIGPFDEQFRTTCEDQDWAHRAKDLGIRFLYNTAITCLHNDQAGDLRRQCSFQERGAHDTVLFCYKHPIHRTAPILRVNGYFSPSDGAVLSLKKLLKTVIAIRPITDLFEKFIKLSEVLHLPEPLLWRLYRMLIGVYIFHGWRRGMATLQKREGTAALAELTAQQGV